MSPLQGGRDLFRPGTTLELLVVGAVFVAGWLTCTTLGGRLAAAVLGEWARGIGEVAGLFGIPLLGTAAWASIKARPSRIPRSPGRVKW